MFRGGRPTDEWDNPGARQPTVRNSHAVYPNRYTKRAALRSLLIPRLPSVMFFLFSPLQSDMERIRAVRPATLFAGSQ